MNRIEILNKAAELTGEGDRNQAYGAPINNMQATADIFNGYWNVRKKKVDCLEPVDVAMFLACVKMARIAFNPDHQDSYIDLAAYAGIAGEVRNKKMKGDGKNGEQ